MLCLFLSLLGTGSQSASHRSVDSSDEIEDPFSAHAKPAAPAAVVKKPSVTSAASAFASKPASGSRSLLSSIVASARDGSGLSESEEDNYSADEFATETKSPDNAKDKKKTATTGSKRPQSAAPSRDKKELKKSSSSSSTSADKENKSRSRSESKSPAPKKKGDTLSDSDEEKDTARSGSRSPSPSSDKTKKKGGGMMKLKALLMKKRGGEEGEDEEGGKKKGKNKSFMDEQREKLENNPVYMKKRKEIALKKLAVAGFMSSSKTTDYSDQVSGLLTDVKECLFHPRLSRGTRELLERQSMPEFPERLKGYIQNKKDSLKKLNKLGPEYTFQPNLNKDSDEEDIDREQKTKAFHERTENDIKRRRDRIKEKKEEEERGCTFQPSLNSNYIPKTKSFVKRYYYDLKKRDEGLEAKIAASKVEAHPFAPQITTNVVVRGTFLERTLRDVEIRNKKQRYRAKLLDVEAPVHGRISIPRPEEDPFHIASIKKKEKDELNQSLKSIEENKTEEGDSSINSPSVSKSRRFLSLTSGLHSTFGKGGGVSISKAPARPSIGSDSTKPPPKRGRKIETWKLREYEEQIKERKRKEKERAKRLKGGVRSRSGSRSRSPSSSRSSSPSSTARSRSSSPRSRSRSLDTSSSSITSPDKKKKNRPQTAVVKKVGGAGDGGKKVIRPQTAGRIRPDDKKKKKGGE